MLGIKITKSGQELERIPCFWALMIAATTILPALNTRDVTTVTVACFYHQ